MHSNFTLKFNVLPVKWLLVFLLITAFGLRSFIPMGYMPDVHSSRFFKITVCSAGGPESVTVDEKMNPVSVPLHSTNHENKDCEFSFLGHFPLSISADSAFTFFSPYLLGESFFGPDKRIAFSRNGNRQAQPRAPPIVL